MPLISVIIPIYNVEKYLNKCVDSVLSQSFQDIEVILVDDGSPDQCPKICDEYEQKDKRVKVIHKENGGLSDARNAGIKLAVGKFVMFLDSDDFWEGTESLEKCISILEKQPDLELLFFDALRYYENENKKVFGDKLLDRNKIKDKSKAEVLEYLIEIDDVRVSACTKILNREFLLKNNLFFKKGILSEDIEWFLRVILYCNSFDYINLPFYIYRKKREGSITNTIGKKNIIDILTTIKIANNRIETIKISSKFGKNYKSYLAYQYSIVMGFYSMLNNLEKKELKAYFLENLSILQFDKYKKTKLIKWLVTLLGFNLTTQILGVYLRLR